MRLHNDSECEGGVFEPLIVYLDHGEDVPHPVPEELLDRGVRYQWPDGSSLTFTRTSIGKCEPRAVYVTLPDQPKWRAAD